MSETQGAMCAYSHGNLCTAVIRVEFSILVLIIPVTIQLEIHLEPK